MSSVEHFLKLIKFTMKKKEANIKWLFNGRWTKIANDSKLFKLSVLILATKSMLSLSVVVETFFLRKINGMIGTFITNIAITKSIETKLPKILSWILNVVLPVVFKNKSNYCNLRDKLKSALHYDWKEEREREGERFYFIGWCLFLFHMTLSS